MAQDKLTGMYADPRFWDWNNTNLAYPGSSRSGGATRVLRNAVPGSTFAASGTPTATASAPGAVGSIASSGGYNPASTLNAYNAAIPGFSGLSAQGSNRIADLMAGKLPGDVQSAIQQGAAQQAVISGMPGSSRISGTLAGNRTLRDLGLTSLQAQQQGFNDLLSMLGAYSGTVVPTAGQSMQDTLERQRLAQQESQFGRNLAQQESQFGRNLGLQSSELALQRELGLGGLDIQRGQLGLESQKIGNQASQFGQQLGLERELGLGRLGLESQQLANQQNQFGQNLALDQARLQQQADQFQASFGQQERQLAQQLGLSERELAFRLADAAAGRELQQQQLALQSQQQDTDELLRFLGLQQNQQQMDLQTQQWLSSLAGQPANAYTTQLFAQLGLPLGGTSATAQTAQPVTRSPGTITYGSSGVPTWGYSAVPTYTTGAGYGQITGNRHI